LILEEAGGGLLCDGDRIGIEIEINRSIDRSAVLCVQCSSLAVEEGTTTTRRYHFSIEVCVSCFSFLFSVLFPFRFFDDLMRHRRQQQQQ
jgi:hypothetical protein